MPDKYGVGEDAYCYPGSTVLRNKLNIRDESTLGEAEQQLSAIAASNVEFSPPPYSLAYLQISITHCSRTCSTGRENYGP
jgi:cell filamentation protein